MDIANYTNPVRYLASIVEKRRRMVFDPSPFSRVVPHPVLDEKRLPLDKSLAGKEICLFSIFWMQELEPTVRVESIIGLPCESLPTTSVRDARTDVEMPHDL